MCHFLTLTVSLSDLNQTELERGRRHWCLQIAALQCSWSIDGPDRQQQLRAWSEMKCLIWSVSSWRQLEHHWSSQRRTDGTVGVLHMWLWMKVSWFRQVRWWLINSDTTSLFPIHRNVSVRQTSWKGLEKPGKQAEAMREHLTLGEKEDKKC